MIFRYSLTSLQDMDIFKGYGDIFIALLPMSKATPIRYAGIKLSGFKLNIN